MTAEPLGMTVEYIAVGHLSYIADWNTILLQVLLWGAPVGVVLQFPHYSYRPHNRHISYCTPYHGVVITMHYGSGETQHTEQGKVAG